MANNGLASLQHFVEVSLVKTYLGLESQSYFLCKVATYRHVYRPDQKNPPNLDLYLVLRYEICHFPIVVLYHCIGQNQKNQPNLVLYPVRRS